MIKVDLSTYNNIDVDYSKSKEEVVSLLENSYMNGWLNVDIDLEKINRTKEIIVNNFDTLVVIGIGGSFLGSKAVIEALSPYYKNNNIEIIYAGYSMEEDKLIELERYLDSKNFLVNVISKSGNTRETRMTYNRIKEKIISKYGKEELIKRIIVTTDAINGELLKEAIANNYLHFIIPDNIGGRYSVCTPAHLLPIAVAGIDINEFIKGYNNGKCYFDEAYKLASVRYSLYKNKKYIENFVVYQEKMLTFSEWIKQLFGETEGKNNKGIFPVSTFYTRDLHSLGQFIQEGHSIIFETVLKCDADNLVNKILIDSVATAHKINTLSNIITFDSLSAYTLGELMYFFMLTSSISGFLFDIDPFNQPGVEVYKKEISKNIES